MTDKLTSEEAQAAGRNDLSKWKREARERGGREGHSRRDEMVARLLDEREAAQDHAAGAAEDERRSKERAEGKC